jgi:hypothetical protein
MEMKWRQNGLLRAVLLLLLPIVLLLVPEAVVEAESRTEAGNSFMSRVLESWRSLRDRLCILGMSSLEILQFLINLLFCNFFGHTVLYNIDKQHSIPFFSFPTRN